MSAVQINGMDELIPSQHRDLVSTRAPNDTTTEKHGHQEHETSYVYFRELAVMNARKSGLAARDRGGEHGNGAWGTVGSSVSGS